MAGRPPKNETAQSTTERTRAHRHRVKWFSLIGISLLKKHFDDEAHRRECIIEWAETVLTEATKNLGLSEEDAIGMLHEMLRDRLPAELENVVLSTAATNFFGTENGLDQ